MAIESFPLSVSRAATLAALWLGLSAAPTAWAQAPAVPTLLVQPAAAAAGFELDGVAQAVRQATVSAQVGGNVTSLLVKAGDAVRAGQALARTDDRAAAAGLQQGDAGLTQAEALLRNARLSLERTRDLRARGFISQAALDSAETQFQAAQAGVQQAQGARSQAALARGFATLVAPFDGVVEATHLDVGDLASPGTPVLSLYAPGALRAVVQVPATRATLARQARAVQVQLPDGRWVTPQRRTELPHTDPVAQTVEWRLDLPADAAAGLAPGRNLRVRFEGAAPAAAAVPAALSVPTAAVLRRGELTAVYVAQGPQFVLRAVRLGTQAGGSVDVLAGLKAGERIASQAVAAGLAGAAPAVR